MKRQADFTICNVGSLVTLNPETPAGYAWIEENIGRDNGYQLWYPDAIIIERRYVSDIVDGIRRDGLVVA